MLLDLPHGLHYEVLGVVFGDVKAHVDDLLLPFPLELAPDDLLRVQLTCRWR